MQYKPFIEVLGSLGAVRHDGDHLRLFLYLLEAAAVGDEQYFGELVDQGSLITSRKELGEAMAWSEAKAYRVLQGVVEAGLIETTQKLVANKEKNRMVNRLKTVVTVRDYLTYTDAKPSPRTASRTGSTQHQKRVAKGYGEAFSRWYEIYPRKQVPKLAEKAFEKAIPRIMELRSCDEEFAIEVLLKRTTTYAACVKGVELSKIPYPATWLNGERYREDESIWKQLAREMGGSVQIQPMSVLAKPRVGKKPSSQLKERMSEQLRAS